MPPSGGITRRSGRSPLLRKELIEDLPAYLRDLHAQSKLLTREEEYTLFRRMNYLKQRASILRQRLKVAGSQANVINACCAFQKKRFKTRKER